MLCMCLAERKRNQNDRNIEVGQPFLYYLTSSVKKMAWTWTYISDCIPFFASDLPAKYLCVAVTI